MKLIILLLFIALICKDNAEERIIGGEIAGYRVTYQAALLYDGYIYCSGSIIHERIILTAAHCLKPNMELSILTVVVGTNYWLEGGKQYHISTIIPHEKFNKDIINLVYDIGIMKTAIPIEFNRNVKPIKLFISPLPENSEMLASGWGQTHKHVELGSLLLKIVTVYLVNNSYCNEMVKLGFDVPPTIICALNSINNGICSGDSGGPLVYKGSLVGVASSGLECGGGNPDLYENVGAYADWIIDNIRKIL